MSTIAITGGTGFIGRALVSAHLLRGDRVRVLTRRPGSEPPGSIPFLGNLSTIPPVDFIDGADIVYHLAAELREPTAMHAVNVVGTGRLLAAAAGRFGAWVQLSSVGVYGPGMPGVPITESTQPAPASAYERSKLAADQLVARVCSGMGARWCIVRPSTVIGADMRTQSARSLARAVIGRRFFYIGAPDAVCTFIHVDDVVRALMAASAAPRGTMVNLSSDCAWTALVTRICERARRKPPRLRMPVGLARPLARVIGRLPGVPLTGSRVDSLSRRGGFPTDLAQELIGFRPSRPMPQGFDEITDQVLLQWH